MVGTFLLAVGPTKGRKQNFRHSCNTKERILGLFELIIREYGSTLYIGIAMVFCGTFGSIYM